MWSRDDRLAEINTNKTDNTHIADSVEACDPILGVAVAANSDMTALTNFVNEACDQVSIRSIGSVRLDEQYLDVSNVNEVKDYFIRPKLLNTIPYTATTRGSIATYDVSAATASLNLYNFSRIAGTYGWRATFCFRLQAVANPFQAGIIRMAFSPFEGAQNEMPTRLGSITAISQLPGVELDLAQNTSVVLKIPFIHADNYFTFVSPNGYIQSLGNLGVFAYTPITIAAGTDTPVLALWHWLEDFELISATSNNIVVPGLFKDGESTVSYAKLPPIVEEFAPLVEDKPAISFVPEVLETQMGKLGASSSESTAIPGNVSNVLAAGSNLVRWAANKIPMISSYAGPTSWFLREASKIAASYGWSRPIHVSPLTKMYATSQAYQNNSDAPDPSFNLGLCSENSIAPLPGFAGTDVDEMSIRYITSIYAAVSVATLSTTDAIGSYIKAIELSPGTMFFQTSTLMAASTIGGITPGLSIRPSGLFALGNCFQLYRGGMKFRIKIAKTKFHTGRLILGFTPYRFDLTNLTRPLDPTNMQFKSVIWDLRESNVMDFECPFVSPLSYLARAESFGTFFIAVLEPLRGPTTVSQSVPMVIEVAGSDDFEFASPTTPYLPPTPRVSAYFAESGDMTVFNKPPSQEPSLLCVGEKVNSIKQVLARASPLLVANASGTFTFQPDRHYPVWTNVSLGYLGNVVSTYYNYFMTFYGLYRGGYHYHVVANGEVLATAARVSGNPSFIDSHVQMGTFDSSMHVKMPYYNKRSRAIITGPSGQYPVDNGMSLFVTRRTVVNPRAFVTFRPAEDFQLGYYCGPPGLAIPSPLSDFNPANTLFQSLMATAR